MRVLRVFWRSLTSMINEDGLMVAGYMAFSTILAIFPMFLVIASVASFLGTDEQVTSIVDFMFDSLPKEVASALEPVVREVLSGRKSGFLTFGALVALWAASTGVEALRQGLNRAYGVVLQRPFWVQRLQSLAIVAFAAFTFLAVSIFLIFGPLLWELANSFVELSAARAMIWEAARYAIGILLTLGLLLAMHCWLPNKKMRVTDVMPGVLLTVLLLVIAATAFSLYISNFANYSVTYGSLAGIVVALLFFYVTAAIFVLGGYFNRYLHEGHETA